MSVEAFGEYGLVGALVLALVGLSSYVVKTARNADCAQFKRDTGREIAVLKEQVGHLTAQDLPRADVAISDIDRRVDEMKDALARLEKKMMLVHIELGNPTWPER